MAALNTRPDIRMSQETWKDHTCYTDNLTFLGGLKSCSSLNSWFAFILHREHQGPVARSMVSANHWLSSIESFLW